jgi:hypothetical protein
MMFVYMGESVYFTFFLKEKENTFLLKKGKKMREEKRKGKKKGKKKKGKGGEKTGGKEGRRG